MNDLLPDDLLGSIVRRGHFLLESGHHGDLWLDLELLCKHPGKLERAIVELAERLRRYQVDAVCGPLNEGAFLALLVAARLSVEFIYAERREASAGEDLYGVTYRIPDALRPHVSNKRVAIVNDVINAGSSVRGSFYDLLACGARPVVIACLLVLGDIADAFAEENQLSLMSLAYHPNQLWTPEDCPFCAAGTPLDAN